MKTNSVFYQSWEGTKNVAIPTFFFLPIITAYLMTGHFRLGHNGWNSQAECYLHTSHNVSARFSWIISIISNSPDLVIYQPRLTEMKVWTVELIWLIRTWISFWLAWHFISILLTWHSDLYLVKLMWLIPCQSPAGCTTDLSGYPNTNTRPVGGQSSPVIVRFLKLIRFQIKTMTLLDLILTNPVLS